LNFILEVPENSIKNSINGKSVIVIEEVVGGHLSMYEGYPGSNLRFGIKKKPKRKETFFII
jgi:hypothetical protein